MTHRLLREEPCESRFAQKDHTETTMNFLLVSGILEDMGYLCAQKQISGASILKLYLLLISCKCVFLRVVD